MSFEQFWAVIDIAAMTLILFCVVTFIWIFFGE